MRATSITNNLAVALQLQHGRGAYQRTLFYWGRDTNQLRAPMGEEVLCLTESGGGVQLHLLQ